MSWLFFCRRFCTSCCISPTNLKKPDNFAWNCRFFKNCRQNTTASTETFTEKQLGHNFALHFTSYLPIALSKILLHSKAIKNVKKLPIFRKNNYHCLSNFFETHIFWNFDHISWTRNQINYRGIWFAKVIIILIMTAQGLFFNVFFKKTRTLMPLRRTF